MKLEPIGSQVILKVIDDETNSVGFIVPEQLRKKHFAKVVAVGPEAKQVATNDKVVYRAQMAFEVELENEKFLVVSEESLVCILRDES